ncbi:MAG: FmdE family protein [Desulfobacterium sp.]|jgi:formylmethanofuran dehydrogenase subunit E|nr:FmdE family protein [Desulfobacterium sp.]
MMNKTTTANSINREMKGVNHSLGMDRTSWCRNHQGNVYTYEEYIGLITSFHGYPAPGLIIGGKMVDLALEQMLPREVLFDAICETSYCLPDAVQILTLCTTGNDWMKVVNLGKFALTLYDKFEGTGVRVFLDPVKMKPWQEIMTWFYKLKPKLEQDTPLLREQIKNGGADLFSIEAVQVAPVFMKKRSLGRTMDCPICGEAFPSKHGTICRGCQGEAPFVDEAFDSDSLSPKLISIPVKEAEGRAILHDMTKIIPGKKKGAAFHRGQVITPGDVCRLQQMGRSNLYLEGQDGPGEQWMHEDKAALAFAKAMAGRGVAFGENPREGKITFVAAKDGLLTIHEDRLEGFNLVPDVMCATRQSYSVVSKDHEIGGTRAIPLYLSLANFNRAMSVIGDEPMIEVLPMRKANVGILITGTEVFQGLIKDGFDAVIRSKVERLACNVAGTVIVPDDRNAIKEGVKSLLADGADLLITTAGLSVDPDDVTRQGLVDAGATNLLYGAPILPGAMTLLASIDKIPVIGVPACALYFKTTSLDLLLPRILADVPITRRDLARMGHGAFCLDCKECKFPRCTFGR